MLLLCWLHVRCCWLHHQSHVAITDPSDHCRQNKDGRLHISEESEPRREASDFQNAAGGQPSTFFPSRLDTLFPLPSKMHMLHMRGLHSPSHSPSHLLAHPPTFSHSPILPLASLWNPSQMKLQTKVTHQPECIMLVQVNPMKRITIAEVRRHPWCGPLLSVGLLEWCLIQVFD